MVRVTKQKVDGINSRVKENVKEIGAFLTSEKKGQDFYDKVTMMKARIDNNLKKLKELIDEIESQGSEITTKEYEESQGDAEERIIDLQVLIVNYKEKQQAKLKLEETEIKRKFELKEKDGQREISAEVERAKLQMEERIQMERVNLERLKLELDSKKHTEKGKAEYQQRKQEYEEMERKKKIEELKKVEEQRSEEHARKMQLQEERLRSEIEEREALVKKRLEEKERDMKEMHERKRMEKERQDKEEQERL